MPVYEAAKSLVLHFGYGDIAVCHGRNSEKQAEDELYLTGACAPNRCRGV